MRHLSAFILCLLLQKDGIFTADILDPNGTHLSDAQPKLQGLAQYADRYSNYYRRIESDAKVGDSLRVLDLPDSTVRKEIDIAKDANNLYVSDIANVLMQIYIGIMNRKVANFLTQLNYFWLNHLEKSN